MPSRIEPVVNCTYRAKPEKGGVWTSTFTPNAEYCSEWIEWCCSEGPHDWIDCDRCVVLSANKEVNVYAINTYKDAEKLYASYGLPETEVSRSLFDWTAISKDYDGVMLTQLGQICTRFSRPISLYGWDCESSIWFRNVFSSAVPLREVKFYNSAIKCRCREGN